MDGYRHYVRTDVNGIVVKGFTDGFEQPQPGDLLVSGYDGRHFTIQLMNERGQYRYKVVSGQMVLRDQAELDAQWSARPAPPPSESDRLKSIESALLSLMGL